MNKEVQKLTEAWKRAEKCGWTQKRFASAMDYSRSYVNQLLQGKEPINDHILSRADAAARQAELGVGNHTLNEPPPPFGNEHVQRITTRSALASDCVAHFIQFLNQCGESAPALERALALLRQYFPTAPIHTTDASAGTLNSKRASSVAEDSMDDAADAANLRARGPKPGADAPSAHKHKRAGGADEE